MIVRTFYRSLKRSWSGWRRGYEIALDGEIRLPTNEDLARQMAEAKGREEYPPYLDGEDYTNPSRLRYYLLLSILMTSLAFLVTFEATDWRSYISVNLVVAIYLIIFSAPIVRDLTKIWWRRRKCYGQCLGLLNNSEKERNRLLLPLARKIVQESFENDMRELKETSGRLVETALVEVARRDWVFDPKNPVVNKEALVAKFSRIMDKNFELQADVEKKMKYLVEKRLSTIQQIDEAEHAIALSDLEKENTKEIPIPMKSLEAFALVSRLTGNDTKVVTPTESLPPPLAPSTESPADVDCSDAVAS